LRRDLAFGCAGLAVAVVYYLSAAGIPESDLADAVGPQGLPNVYAYLLGALSLALIAGSLRNSGFGIRDSGSGIPSPQSPVPSPWSSIRRAAGIIAIGALYIAVIPWVGYLLSLSGLIALTTYYQGGGLNRRTMLVALSGGFAFWLLFVFLLGIEHPAGIWPDLF
jgi:hypothetical protein